MQPEKTAEILRLIAEEGKSLRNAAETLNIPFSTAWDAVNAADFAGQYARAREERGEYLAEDALKVCDDQTIDPAHKRIMVDTRKWFASKLDSKRYGEKLDLNHGGSVKVTKIETTIVDPVEDNSNSAR